LAVLGLFYRQKVVHWIRREVFKILEWEVNLHHPSHLEVASVLNNRGLVAYEEFWLVVRVGLAVHKSKALKHATIID
jgi:hypothetical protein